MGWTKERWDAEIGEVRKLYAEDPLNIYSESYYARRRKMREWEMGAGKALSQALKIKSMVDFGCALGSYLEGTLQANTKYVLGIDIGYDRFKEYVPPYMRRFMRAGNVGEPIDCGKWDCAFSIEVAEHLLPEEEDVFVDNVIKASSRLIVVTAAYSFSYLHINAGKRPDYWENKFIERGCELLPKHKKKLQEYWAGKCKGHIIKKVIVARPPL